MRSSEREHMSSNRHGRVGSVSCSSSSGSPSSIILSQNARRRSMEEVWKDMSLAPLDQHQQHRYSQHQHHHHHQQQQQQQLYKAHPTTSPSFRAMILQDFLSRAPAPMEKTPLRAPPPPSPPLPPIALSLSSAGPEIPFMGSSPLLHRAPANPHPHPHPHPCSRSSSNSSASEPLGSGHNESCVTGSYISPAFSDAILAPPSPAGLFPFCPKKRDSEGPGVGGDRRHKRMIKNRESAARSRARKQAYTNELELEVAHLLEENAKLKKQHDELRLAMAAQLPTRKTLQRSSTAPF